jgi:hypothetical protein
MRKPRTYLIKTIMSLTLLSAALLAAGNASAGAVPARATASPTFTARVFASGADLTHSTPKGKEMISKPDDITSIGSHIFVGFQNGVGPQGQASTTGNRDSTVVEFSLKGHAIAQWDVAGKCDGLTSDPMTGRLIATVNEDAHSSLYLIDPIAGATLAHYRYNEALPSKGGTDAISVYRGMIFISGSAPGTTGAAAPQASYPPVYRVVLDAKTHVAAVHRLFSDEAKATVANANSSSDHRSVQLALTDPDSNEDVPAYATRFAGDFMLTSQGDKEQIYVHDAGGSHQKLLVLTLSDSVDDTAWASDISVAIYTTDNSNDTIYKITASYTRGAVFVADTPCDANGAPSTCPGPGFTANYLGRLNSETGVITRVHVTGLAVAAQGLLFLGALK